MSLKSINNFSQTPLASGRMFIGRYDNVLEYSTACIVINSDKNTELTIYQSVNKQITYTETFQTVGGSPYIQFFNLSSPFVYFTVLNTGSDMDYLQFEVIYRTVNVSTGGGGAGGNVNIFDSVGNNILSTGNNALNVISQKTRVSKDAWETATVAPDDVSAVCTLNAYNANNVSIYGNCSGEARLAVQFSSNNSTWFTTQYYYDIPVNGGNFGFSINCAASYVRLKRTDQGISRIISAVIEGC